MGSWINNAVQLESIVCVLTFLYNYVFEMLMLDLVTAFSVFHLTSKLIATSIRHNFLIQFMNARKFLCETIRRTINYSVTVNSGVEIRIGAFENEFFHMQMVSRDQSCISNLIYRSSSSFPKVSQFLISDYILCSQS